jgi:sarcosine oxidase / L-pipecolate oxidase
MGSTKYAIVGAGCFGASTALALKKVEPDAEIVLVDRNPFPSLQAAAHDLNKIIRSEYEDPMDMQLALEAMDIWRTDTVYKPYFHQTGILFAGIEGPGQDIVDGYERLLGKGNSPAVLLDPKDAQPRFDGVFRQGNWEGVTKCISDPFTG